MLISDLWWNSHAVLPHIYVTFPEFSQEELYASYMLLAYIGKVHAYSFSRRLFLVC